jgi:hypothetical protein
MTVLIPIAMKMAKAITPVVDLEIGNARCIRSNLRRGMSMATL